MRTVIPANGKITDEAKEAVHQCVVEYITYITGEANARCRREHRKILTAGDILWSMYKLGFYDYIEPLTLFLTKYRAAVGNSRRKVRGPHVPVCRYLPPPPTQVMANVPIYTPQNFQVQAVPVAMSAQGPAVGPADGGLGLQMCGNNIAGSSSGSGSGSGLGSDQMFWDELVGLDFDDLLQGLDEDWGEDVGEKEKGKEKEKENEKGKEKEA